MLLTQAWSLKFLFVIYNILWVTQNDILSQKLLNNFFIYLKGTVGINQHGHDFGHINAPDLVKKLFFICSPWQVDVR